MLSSWSGTTGAIKNRKAVLQNLLLSGRYAKARAVSEREEDTKKEGRGIKWRRVGVSGDEKMQDALN